MWQLKTALHRWRLGTSDLAHRCQHRWYGHYKDSTGSTGSMTRLFARTSTLKVLKSKAYEIDVYTFCRSKSVEKEKQEKKTDKDGSQDRHCLVLHVRFAQLPDVGGEEVVGVPVEEAGHAPVRRSQTKKNLINLKI